MALRGWGVPRGGSFNTRARQEQFLHLISGKHRSISRMWPAWLKAAWPHAEIWTGYRPGVNGAVVGVVAAIAMVAIIEPQ